MEPLTATDPHHVGPYRLLGRLGSGGMGVVYQCETADHRVVAVKVIHDRLAADPGFRARFGREVELCRRVGGLCTARVLDADVDAPLPFMVTEFVPGPDLEAFVERHGPLPVPQVRALAGGMAEALIAIHAAGSVHRDLKPSNVLLAPTGPKVIDFGIAAVAGGTMYTSTGLVMGTPGWMAPEQVLGARLEPAMDVFAWGLVTIFACTGRHPFGMGAAHAVMYRTVHHQPDLSGVDPEISWLVRAALSKTPSARPTPAQLLAALTGENPDRPLQAVTQVLELHWKPPPPGTVTGRANRPRASSGRSRAARDRASHSGRPHERTSWTDALDGEALWPHRATTGRATTRRRGVSAGRVAIVAIVVGVAGMGFVVLRPILTTGAATGTPPTATASSSSSVSPVTDVRDPGCTSALRQVFADAASRQDDDPTNLSARLRTLITGMDAAAPQARHPQVRQQIPGFGSQYRQLLRGLTAGTLAPHTVRVRITSEGARITQFCAQAVHPGEP